MPKPQKPWAVDASFLIGVALGDPAAKSILRVKTLSNFPVEFICTITTVRALCKIARDGIDQRIKEAARKALYNHKSYGVREVCCSKFGPGPTKTAGTLVEYKLFLQHDYSQAMVLAESAYHEARFLLTNSPVLLKPNAIGVELALEVHDLSSVTIAEIGLFADAVDGIFPLPKPEKTGPLPAT
jgi:hypothetical protein